MWNADRHDKVYRRTFATFSCIRDIESQVRSWTDISKLYSDQKRRYILKFINYLILARSHECDVVFYVFYFWCILLSFYQVVGPYDAHMIYVVLGGGVLLVAIWDWVYIDLCDPVLPNEFFYLFRMSCW